MKFFLPLLILLVAVSFASAITVQEVVKLTKLHTSDDVIIQTIHKSKLDKPLTSKDVIYLKEQGVSDRVISELMEKKDVKAEKDDPYRVYHTTDKNGRQVTVVTNLDERGHRMGGEVPLQKYEREEPVYSKSSQFPSEIRVTIEHEAPPPDRDDYEEELPPPNGIPAYDSYAPSYYPGYPLYPGYGSGGGFFPRHHGRCCGQFPTTSFSSSPFTISANPGVANWRFDAGYNRVPRVNPPRPQPPVSGSSAGIRPIH